MEKKLTLQRLGSPGTSKNRTARCGTFLEKVQPFKKSIIHQKLNGRGVLPNSVWGIRSH